MAFEIEFLPKRDWMSRTARESEVCFSESRGSFSSGGSRRDFCSEGFLTLLDGRVFPKARLMRLTLADLSAMRSKRASERATRSLAEEV